VDCHYRLHLLANSAVFNEAFAINNSEKQVIHQILMDAMESKDIRISVRKYGAALTQEQKDILSALQKMTLINWHLYIKS
jgi:hypothetical protein